MSSRSLANAMAASVPLTTGGPVIELGGGTGVVTQALLDRGVPPEELVVVERNDMLHGLLTQRFPAVRVLHGSAADLTALLRPLELPPGRAVVSGMPIISMPRHVQRAIVEQSFAAMNGDGTFVQFTYGPVSPLPRRALQLHGSITKRVFANLPPARVWVYRRVRAWQTALSDVQAFGSA